MRLHVVASISAIAALALMGACGGKHPGDPDASPPDVDAPDPADSVTADASIPQTIDQTGLCSDAACAQINTGILTYAPRWALWADAASKKRWLYLPPGTKIDTSDMNWWSFPQGTKLWKEFDSAGIRVETRMYWKMGTTDSDWYQVAYVWNATQDLAVATPLGMDNANGTQHDVPARSQCRQCHDRTPGRILGFSALELDSPAAPGDVDLDYLVKNDLLTDPPASSGVTGAPYFALWSDASPNDIAAIGYLHANCGHCHNPHSDVISQCPRLFRIDVAQLAGSKTATDTYTSTVNQVPATSAEPTATGVVVPQDPDHSALYLRFTSTGLDRMPPLATEVIDSDAATILHDWIVQMPKS